MSSACVQFLFCVAAFGFAGCAERLSQPRDANSATGQSTYALEYPFVIESVTQSTIDAANRANAIITAMPGYSAAVRAADPSVALLVIDAADAAGRAKNYVDASRELDAATAFFDEAGETIALGAVSSAGRTLRDKGCDADIAPAVRGALREGVALQIRKRVRAHNEAAAILDRQRAGLNSEVATTLEKQADAVAFASYVAYVALAEAKQRLTHLVRERADVERTMHRLMDEERLIATSGTHTEAERKASGERTQVLVERLNAIGKLTPAAQGLLTQLDFEITGLQRAYQAALKDVQTRLAPRR